MAAVTKNLAISKKYLYIQLDLVAYAAYSFSLIDADSGVTIPLTYGNNGSGPGSYVSYSAVYTQDKNGVMYYQCNDMVVFKIEVNGVKKIGYTYEETAGTSVRIFQSDLNITYMDRYVTRQN